VKVHIIDQEFLGTKHAVASFLVEAPEGHILIESGPATTQDVLEKKVRALGVDLEAVKHVLVTHIHLDHSGGAGYWARRGSTVYVHPKGARHLIDPERLLSSAKRIYQEQMDRLWGQTLPVPAERVVEFSEGTLTIAGVQVEALETPGHATHHVAFRIGDDVFTGDVAACRLPGSKFVSVPGPPPEFHLETWLSSVETLRSQKANRLFLTHFGEVTDVDEHLEQLDTRLKACADFVHQHLDKGPDELARLYQAWDRSQALEWGVDDATYQAYEKANPSFMSAQGIARYWKKRLEAPS
jgi:glyoxylase-like metal-dependent hydrolase (beta-lactamase superfamily II)